MRELAPQDPKIKLIPTGYTSIYPLDAPGRDDSSTAGSFAETPATKKDEPPVKVTESNAIKLAGKPAESLPGLATTSTTAPPSPSVRCAIQIYRQRH